jgi:hypothetical protein
MTGLWLQDLPARLGDLGGAVLAPLQQAPLLTQLALAATLLAAALVLFLQRSAGAAANACGWGTSAAATSSAGPAPRQATRPSPSVTLRRRRAAMPRYDLDRIPGPWRRAWPVLGNIPDLISPDFHRKTLQWADQYGGFTR